MFYIITAVHRKANSINFSKLGCNIKKAA